MPHKVINQKTGKPFLRMNWNCDQAYWDHGYSKYELAGLGAHRYIMKYITKDIRDDEFANDVGFSRKPVLGYRYFRDRARDYVRAGLSPQDRIYGFSDVKQRNGERIKFWMSDATLDYFCARYLEYWAAERGGDYPASEVIEEYCDRMAKKEWPLEMRRRQVLSRPWLDPRTGKPAPWESFAVLVDFIDAANCWAYGEPGSRLWWSFDREGKRAWASEIRTETWAEAHRVESDGRKMSSAQYRKASRGT